MCNVIVFFTQVSNAGRDGPDVQYVRRKSEICIKLISELEGAGTLRFGRRYNNNLKKDFRA